MTQNHCGIIITNIGQLVTFADADGILAGSAMNNLDVIENAAIAIQGTEILEVGTARDIIGKYEAQNYIDALGMLVTPGLIDSHTHPVFAKSRSEEFEMRLQGKSYEEIMEAGGGIQNSADALRSISEEYLKELVQNRLNQMNENGTTTVECKSGYGLSKYTELLSLKILSKSEFMYQIEIVPTFLGAHVVPKDFADKREDYISMLLDMIPEIAERKLAEYVDIYIEKNAYTPEEAILIGEKATEHGLKIRLHTNQFNSIGGIEAAVKLGAKTVEHLEVLGAKEITKIKKAGIIPVLLPGCSFFLNDKRYPAARKMIDAGLPIVLATDYNPGSSHILSLPFIMTLGVLKMKMTIEETLAACTVNAAYALDRGDKIGKIKPGYQADIVVWKVPKYRDIIYNVAQNQVSSVIKKGRIVVENYKY